MAVYGIGTIMGPISGPLLGGWLTENYSWRWIFYVNLPVGMLCVARHPRLHPSHPERRIASRSTRSASSR